MITMSMIEMLHNNAALQDLTFECSKYLQNYTRIIQISA